MKRVNKATPYLADFFVNSNVERRKVVFVFDNQLGVLSQQQTEALDVSVLATKMTRRVPIDVLSVQVDFFVDQSFDYVEISTNAGHVQRCAQVL